MKTARQDTVVPAFDPQSYARVAETKTALRPVGPMEELDEEAVLRCELVPGKIPELSHREAFVLMHVDGVSTVESVIEATGLPHADVMDILARLRDQGLVVASHSSSSPPSGVRRLLPNDSRSLAKLIAEIDQSW